MEHIYNLLNKLDYVAYNFLIIIIVPMLYVYTLYTITGIVVVLIGSKLLAKWGDKEISLNNLNERN